MEKIKFNKITKEEFNKLVEDDLMFITNPGRMGDEDGSNFIIKKDGNYFAYRVDGWMYGERTSDSITLNDMLNKFPMWSERWHNWDNDNLDNKYKYIYMGFGNGLSVDKSIYDEFYKYLLEEAKKTDLYKQENREDYNPSINYKVWQDAFINFSLSKNRLEEE